MTVSSLSLVRAEFYGPLSVSLVAQSIPGRDPVDRLALQDAAGLIACRCVLHYCPTWFGRTALSDFDLFGARLVKQGRGLFSGDCRHERARSVPRGIRRRP